MKTRVSLKYFVTDCRAIFLGGMGVLGGGEFAIVTFVNLLFPIILKYLNLKKSLQRIMKYKVLLCWSKLRPNYKVFPTGAENKDNKNKESSTS